MEYEDDTGFSEKEKRSYGKHLPLHPLRAALKPGDEILIRAVVKQTPSVYWNGLVVEVDKGPNNIPGINGSTFTVPCECVAYYRLDPAPKNRTAPDVV